MYTCVHSIIRIPVTLRLTSINKQESFLCHETNKFGTILKIFKIQ